MSPDVSKMTQAEYLSHFSDCDSWAGLRFRTCSLTGAAVEITNAMWINRRAVIRGRIADYRRIVRAARKDGGR